RRPYLLLDAFGEVGASRSLVCALHQDLQRRFQLDSLSTRTDRHDAGHIGCEAGDDLAHRRRKQIDAAHDHHVVGAADAAHPWRGAAAAAWRGPDNNMVAGAKPEERRPTMPEMGEHEFAPGTVFDRDRDA